LPVGANIYGGGTFSTAGVSRAVNIAQWKPETTETSGVVPDSGSVSGGYQVVITGTNLGNGSDVTNVTLCGVSVASIVSQSVTQIVVIAGAKVTPGLGDVRVFSGSQGETVRPDAFTYIDTTSTITFDSAGGSAVAPITQSEGTAITPPANPTRAGYLFAGWDPALPGTMPVGDVTCVAQWTAASTVTFDSAGGSAVAPITQAEGTAITPPANPTRTGYTFAGWTPALPGNMPDDDVTCVAQWTANQSTITFNSAGGSAVAPITQDEGTAITPPANPTRAGYLFAGWDPALPGTMPVGDVTCVAQWTAVSTVTFDSAGGSAVAPITQAEGTVITRPADPTRTGYTFRGWVPDVPGTMPDDDVTCVAQWRAKSDQVITSFWPPNGSVFFTTDRVGLSALATSGLPVGFSVSGGPGVLSDGTNLTFTAFGQVAVVAAQPGDGNWNPAPSVTNFYTIHGVPVVGPITVYRATNNLSLKIPQSHFLTNAVDPEGSAMTVFWASPASVNGGSATNVGYWTEYVPPLGNDAPDYFQFRVRNAFGGVAEGTAQVIVFIPTNNGLLCISGIAPSTSNTLVRIAGIPGRNYDVQSRTNLVSDPWRKVGAVTIGARGYVIFTDTNAPAGQRYYRIAKPE
jgi:uncharacterized repeat protein (TIGR02543 family)